jgi:hypothetical protein
MSSSSTDDSSDVESWVEWFLIQEGHEFLCEIDRSFIGKFNKNHFSELNKLYYFLCFFQVFADHALFSNLYNMYNPFCYQRIILICMV